MVIININGYEASLPWPTKKETVPRPPNRKPMRSLLICKMYRAPRQLVTGYWWYDYYGHVLQDGVSNIGRVCRIFYNRAFLQDFDKDKSNP